MQTWPNGCPAIYVFEFISVSNSIWLLNDDFNAHTILYFGNISSLSYNNISVFNDFCNVLAIFAN